MRSLVLRAGAVLLIAVNSLNVSPMAAQPGSTGSLPLQATVANTPKDWSVALVESTLARNPDPKKFGGWGYARSLYLFGQYLVYKRTRDPRYLDYIRQWIDVHIDDNGVLDRKIDALDYI